MRYTKQIAQAAVAGAVLVIASAIPATPAAAQVSTSGDEVAFSGGPTARLYSPAAAFATDETVLVWEGSKDGVGRQRVAATGAPVGGRTGLAANDLPAQVPYEGPVTLQRDPSVVTLEQNRIVSIWVEERQQVDVDIFYQESEVVASRVMARRFNRQARPIGQLYALGEGGPSEGLLESAPAAARLTNGRMVVVWHTTDGEARTGIYGRLLNGRGMPIGDVFRVDDTTGGAGARPAVTPAAGGGFLVAWQGCCDAGGDDGIFVRTFDAEAAALGTSTRINAVTAGSQIWPALARGTNGGYLAAWMTPGAPASGLEFQVVGRPLDADGAPTGSQAPLSQGEATAHGAPTLAGAPDGFVVAWTTWRGSFTASVLAVAVTPEGTPRGKAIRVSSGPVGTQWQLAMAADGKGNFLAAWQGFDEDGKPSINARPLTTAGSGSRSAQMAPPR